jgi:hypothetical protein
MRTVLVISCVIWPFRFLLGSGGEADLGEGGRDVGRSVMESGAGLADGYANELDASPGLLVG